MPRDIVPFSVQLRADAALKRAFADAFSSAMNREDARSFAGAYRRFVSERQGRAASMPSSRAWGDPALSGFLDLMRLADHPGDALTYRHFALTPLAAAMYPGGAPPAAEISREMASSFTARGVVRTLRAIRALLPEDPFRAWSRFTEERFADMLRAAAKFEAAMSPGTRLADFASFLRAEARLGAGGGEKAPDAAGRFARGPRVVVRRRLPSQGFREGMSAGELFAGGGRASALRLGTEAHAGYANVEWVSAEDARNDFERALVKPAGFVALWRERPFEVFAGGAWTSGRFDRVVVYRENGELRADVVDFKTNRPMRGEGAADFASRMREAYAGQMRAYRFAVSALTGIPPLRISTRLCLSATGAAAEVT